MIKALFTLPVVGLAVMFFPAAQGSFTSSPKYTLPEVNYNDLVVLDESVALKLSHDLISLGAIQITNIPHFKEAREEALDDLATCLSADPTATSVLMNDNTKRLSTGAVSMHGVPTKMSSECGASAGRLRAAVDAAARQLLLALDVSMALTQDSAAGDGLLDVTYDTFESIHAKGEHLEHLHAYMQDEGSTTDASAGRLYVGAIDGSEGTTMPMHTDGGLFIAMTTGYYKDSRGNHLSTTQPTIAADDASTAPPAVVENGLYITLSTGTVVKVVSGDDALIFMIGEGGAKWLSPRLGQPLRAVPHAMVADISTDAVSRAWFGKMYLPPSDAVSLYWKGMNYAEYSRATTAATVLAVEKGDTYVTLPAACGHRADVTTDSSTPATATTVSSPRKEEDHVHAYNAYTRYQPMLSNTLCANGEGVMCWQACFTGSDLPSCGVEAECVDPVTDEPVDGEAMCSSSEGMDACYLKCPNQNITDEFCYGVGTSMFMSGFTSIALEDRGATACVNLFFDTWTLDTKDKYIVGCLGVFFLAIFFEYMKVMKRQIMGLEKVKAFPTWAKDCITVLFYGAQLTISYFLMLAAMTYATELFCAMISGLTVGYALFTLKSTSKDSSPTCHDTGADEEPYVEEAKVVKKDTKGDLETSCCGEEARDDVEANSLYDNLLKPHKRKSTK